MIPKDLSPDYWQYGYDDFIEVGDRLFWDHERVLDYIYVNEICLEPVSGDPYETTLEPVFFCSGKDGRNSMELSLDDVVSSLVEEDYYRKGRQIERRRT